MELAVNERPALIPEDQRPLIEENIGLRHDLMARNAVIERKERELSHLRRVISDQNRRIRTIEASWKYEKANAACAEKKLRGHRHLKTVCALLTVGLAFELIVATVLWTMRWPL